jgi:HK97 family phage major capsid protein
MSHAIEQTYETRKADFLANCEHRDAYTALTRDFQQLKTELRAQVVETSAAFEREGRAPLASEARKLRALAEELTELEAAMGRKTAQHAELDRQASARHEARSKTWAASSTVARMPSLSEWKSARIGSDPEGGYLVSPAMGPFHDALRPQLVFGQMNPRIVDMPTLEMLLPGITAGTTVYALGEEGTLTAAEPSFHQVRLSAKKYACRTLASAELLADSNPSAREIIAADHARQLAQRLDLDMLEGTGNARILGLRQLPNVTQTALGTGNGAAPTLDDLADLLYRLERDNANRARTYLVMHPRTWNGLGKLQDQQDRYQLSPDPTSAAPRSLFGVPVLTSSQISITETTGSSTDCSYILAVDADQLVIGRRADVGVLIDPYSHGSTDQVQIISRVRYDFALLHTKAAQVLTGVRA